MLEGISIIEGPVVRGVSDLQRQGQRISREDKFIPVALVLL